jgi:hypothetical protein
MGDENEGCLGIEAMIQKLQRNKRPRKQDVGRLRKEMIEGCRDMADVYLAIEREYHPLEEEVQRAVDGSAEFRK